MNTDRKKTSKIIADTPHTLQEWIVQAAAQLQVAGVNLENGMQKPYLEAEYLAHHALVRSASKRGERHCADTAKGWRAQLRQPPPAKFIPIFADILAQRIQQRLPAAYITGTAYFGGHIFTVNQDVLIPRSRLENLLDDLPALRQLLGNKPTRRLLDLGTGSGCLAITFALAFPRAKVDAADISVSALAVAETNRRHFKLEKRLRLVHSDLFSNLVGRQYDLIIANPPYVCQASMAALPAEYQHEPVVALDGGHDGLALVEPILRQVADFLTPHGILVCEVGDETEMLLKERWPDLPVEWIFFHFGASGVFVARGADLRHYWG